MNRQMPWGLAIGTAILTCLAATMPVLPLGANEYFKGKTINLIIGGAGGYDTYSRFLIPYYTQHLPGNPRIIPQNMPGAGTLLAANYLYEVAPPDGTVIGTVGGGTATAELFKTEGIRFDPRRYVWIGSLNSEVGIVLTWHTSPVKTIEDAMAREVLIGGGGPTSGNVIFPIVLNQVLGTQFKIIAGYPSQGEIALAIERGEVEGLGSYHYSGMISNHPAWLKENKINKLLQLSEQRHAAMPDVPTVFDKAKTEEDRAVLELIFARQRMGRPYLAPPATPDEISDILRRSFDAMAADPEFKAEAERRMLDLNDVMTGKQIHDLIERLYQQPPELVAKAIDATDTSHIRANR